MHASFIGRDSHFRPVHFEAVDCHLMREPGRRVATEPVYGNRARDKGAARNANQEVGLGMMYRVFQARSTTEGLRWRRRLSFWDGSTRTLLREAARQDHWRRSTRDQQPQQQVPPQDEPRTRERTEARAAMPFLRSLVRAMEQAAAELPQEVEVDAVKEDYLTLFEKDRARAKAAKRRVLWTRESP